MTLLLLAGTKEAKQIAWGLADKGMPVLASLAGATRQPEPLPVPTRIGGFGGEDGFKQEITARGITAVLDATHPFATAITDRTARLCKQIGLPYAQVVRPAWTPTLDDNWQEITAPQDAANYLPPDAVVFLATGRQTLAQFGNLEGRRILVRVIDPPIAPLPFEGGEFIIGRPPFTPQNEVDLFRSLGVTHLVVKNAGGTGGRAKLEAARELGLPVLMIRRPEMPDVVHFSTAQDALLWIAEL